MMKSTIACLALAAAATLPLAAHGQPPYEPDSNYRGISGYGSYVANGSPDSRYCTALIERYYNYVANPYDPTSRRRFTATVGAAVAHCQQGDFAAGIPVLERALTDAKVALPRRG